MTGETSTAIAGAKVIGYASAVAIFNYLKIPQEQMAILTALMLIDFLTGVAKQFRIDASKITSHNAWLGIIKKVTTLLVPFTIGFILKQIDIDGTAYINGVLSILIVAEGYSIIQNVYACRTGTLLPEFDVISLLLKNTSDFIKDKLDRMTRISAMEGEQNQPEITQESPKTTETTPTNSEESSL